MIINMQRYTFLHELYSKLYTFLHELYSEHHTFLHELTSYYIIKNTSPLLGFAKQGGKQTR